MSLSFFLSLPPLLFFRELHSLVDKWLSQNLSPLWSLQLLLQGKSSTPPGTWNSYTYTVKHPWWNSFTYNMHALSIHLSIYTKPNSKHIKQSWKNTFDKREKSRKREWEEKQWDDSSMKHRWKFAIKIGLKSILNFYLVLYLHVCKVLCVKLSMN